MATPIPSRDLFTLLLAGMVLPLASFLAALDFHRGRKRALNVLGFALGLLAVAVVAGVLAKYA